MLKTKTVTVDDANDTMCTNVSGIFALFAEPCFTWYLPFAKDGNIPECLLTCISWDRQTGDNQVKGIKNGMMLNIGGSATTNYVFIVGKE